MAERAFVAEGPKLLEEALVAGAAVESVYWSAGAPPALLEQAGEAGAQLYEVEAATIERVADSVSPQPVLSVVATVDRPLTALQSARLVVVLAGVADPGNAGTAVRAALAAGAEGVVFAGSTVDPYNPKTVRSTAGTLFRLPIVVSPDAPGVLHQLGEWGMRRLGAVSTGGLDYAERDLTQRTALVLGNEAHGLGAAVLAELDELVSIPMAGGVESLNVGVAAAVLCFEASRQARCRQPVVSARPEG
ncbi:MAG TPA: RNA methyltransferase [Acidimicrobiales bacterium]|nr:RNA methyltransferase [Acidimicrobiales bacterium]